MPSDDTPGTPEEMFGASDDMLSENEGAFVFWPEGTEGSGSGKVSHKLWKILNLEKYQLSRSRINVNVPISLSAHFICLFWPHYRSYTYVVECTGLQTTTVHLFKTRRVFAKTFDI